MLLSRQFKAVIVLMFKPVPTLNKPAEAATVHAPVKTDLGAMAMVSTLFFAWGFLTCLNDILIPHLKNIFDLNYAEVMLVQFAFFSSYFVFSLPSGKVVEWIGYARSMVAGLVTMGCGALLFVPAAMAPSFPLFLTALIVLGLALALGVGVVYGRRTAGRRAR